MNGFVIIKTAFLKAVFFMGGPFIVTAVPTFGAYRYVDSGQYALASDRGHPFRFRI